MTDGPNDRRESKRSLVERLVSLRTPDLSRRGRQTLVGGAFGLFVVFTVAAWRQLPDLERDVDPRLLVVAALLVLPGAVANAAEYSASARVAGVAVPGREALRVAVVAAAFNLLPLPGSVAVRTVAMRRSGVATRSAFAATMAVGLAYLGVALAVVAVVQASSGAWGLVAALLPAGALMVGACWFLVARHGVGPAAPHLGRIVGVEFASVVIKALRLFLVIRALGFDATLVQAVSVSLSTVAASAVGIFPGGLGLRELFAALISPAVGIPAAVGLVGAAVDRLVALATLSVLSIPVLAFTKEQPVDA